MSQAGSDISDLLKALEDMRAYQASLEKQLMERGEKLPKKPAAIVPDLLPKRVKWAEPAATTVAKDSEPAKPVSVLKKEAAKHAQPEGRLDTVQSDFEKMIDKFDDSDYGDDDAEEDEDNKDGCSDGAVADGSDDEDPGCWGCRRWIGKGALEGKAWSGEGWDAPAWDGAWG